MKTTTSVLSRKNVDDIWLCHRSQGGGSCHGGPFVRPRPATIALVLRADEGDSRRATRLTEFMNDSLAHDASSLTYALRLKQGRR